MGRSFVPKYVFFTKGHGVHKEKLISFEMALRDAGISQFNLVRVSSIFPPHCQKIPKEKGLKHLKPGQIVFCVISQNATNEANRLISCSIGCALPKDSSHHGYISEYHGFGETDEKTGEYSEDLAATMLATTLDIGFDSQKDWSDREQVYKMSGKIIKTFNTTQSAVSRSDKNGLWTTVITAAVFIPYKIDLK